MADGEFTVTNTGIQNIDAVLIGTKWDSVNLTFTFPTASSYFTDNPYEIFPAAFDQGYVDDFITFNSTWQNAARTIINQINGVSGLNFSELINPGPTSQADVVFAQTSDSSLGTASARFPGWENEGHQWYKDSNFDTTPVLGTRTWHAILENTGHSLGLANGHSPDTISGTFTGRILTSDRDSMEFSVMTARSYVGASTTGGFTNEQFGYAQSLMMYDIAALQTLYGANYSENASGNTYTWSTTTGEMFIDGVGQGAAGANRIFRTIWDGNGTDTFDLTNYSTDLQIDLTPGGWSVFDSSQLANLGNGNFARGNVFNALLFNDDERSLIENVNAGAGDDLVVGNRTTNTIWGNAGDDTLVGAGGNDTLFGGSEDDLLYGDETGPVPSGVTLNGTGTITHGNVFDTMSQAFDVTARFALFTDANVDGSDTNPHVTLKYTSGIGGATQWYKITLNEGAQFTVDTDATSGGLDTWIRLYDANGTLVSENDQHAVSDAGSNTNNDSFLTGTVPATGTYFIEIGHWSGGVFSPLAANHAYDLHVTVGPIPSLGTDGVGGDDVLNAGIGNDTLFGGIGNDSLYGEGNNDTIHGDGGNDTIFGGAADDLLYGGESNDIVNGDGGNDTIFGGIGNDIMNGGIGVDTMYGNVGNDFYYVDDADDVVTELAGEGVGDYIFSTVSFTSFDNIERLYLSGMDNISATGVNGQSDILVGNSGNNTLDGLTGTDAMFGDDGNDIYIVDDEGDLIVEKTNEGFDYIYSSVSYENAANAERLYLTGMADLNATGRADQSDVLIGNTGNNTLDGLAGSDIAIGGLGNDVFRVDHLNDLVIENAGEGMDYIFSSVSYTNAVHAERLYLTGAANINATGRNDQADILVGNTGSNSLDGLAGADIAIGGLGDDFYFVDNPNDLVIENAGQGSDIVYTSVTYQVTEHTERLIAQAGEAGAVGLTALNFYNNIVVGNEFTNVLIDQFGRDTYIGGGGADFFRFIANLDGLNNVNRINDFNSADDQFQLLGTVYNGINTGILNSDAFHIGLSAQDANDRIVYDQSGGVIYYDPDGSGAQAQIEIVNVTPGTTITAEDFQIF